MKVGSDDPLPDEMPGDLEEFADRMLELYPHGSKPKSGCFGAVAANWPKCFAVARTR